MLSGRGESHVVVPSRLSTLDAVDVEPVEPELAKPQSAPISTQEMLPDFVRVLYDEVGMHASFRHELCPVELDTGASQVQGRKRLFAFILLAEMMNSDVVEEVTRALKLKEFQAADPLYYIATPKMMLSLSRGGTTSNRSGKVGVTTVIRRRGDNALWSNFADAGRYAWREDASDLHFEIADESEFSQLRFCIDGEMVAPAEFRWPTVDMMDTLSHVWQKSKGASHGTFSLSLPQQTSVRAMIDGHDANFRWGSMQSYDGHVTVMRLLKQGSTEHIRTFEELGFFQQQAQMWARNTVQQGGGAVTSGVIGSGKTTTLQAAMMGLPDSMNKVAVEDPVELVTPGVHHFQVARSPDDKTDEDPFLVFKRMIKRMNAHVVWVSEMRDAASAGLFRDVAGAGLRALATVHAPSAVATPDRLADGELQIPRGVLATPGFINLYSYQALLRRTCPHCAIRDAQMKNALGVDKLREIERLFKFDVGAIKLRNLEGCDHCRRPGLPSLNGARGRIVVAEMFEPDDPCLLFIRDSKTLELGNYVRSMRTTGFDVPDCTGKTVLEVAMYRVFDGTVDPREVEAKFGSFIQYELKTRCNSGGNVIAMAGHGRSATRSPRPMRRDLSSWANQVRAIS